MIIPPDPSSPAADFLWTVLNVWWVLWMSLIIKNKVKELMK